MTRKPVPTPTAIPAGGWVMICSLKDQNIADTTHTLAEVKTATQMWLLIRRHRGESTRLTIHVSQDGIAQEQLRLFGKSEETLEVTKVTLLELAALLGSTLGQSALMLYLDGVEHTMRPPEESSPALH